MKLVPVVLVVVIGAAVVNALDAFLGVKYPEGPAHLVHSITHLTLGGLILMTVRRK